MTTPSFVAAVVVLLTSIAGCRGRPSTDGALTTSSSSSPTAAQATFRVEGMHCATCPLTVKTAAEGVTGVKGAKVDMAAKSAVVTYDSSKTSTQVIAAAITESGYPATPIDGASPK